MASTKTATNGQNKQVDIETQKQIEETLKQANTVSKESKKETEKQAKEAMVKASQKIDEKTANQAKELVKADKVSKQARFKTGVREGIEDSKDIRKGYQLGLMTGLTQAKIEDTKQLSEQLKALRDYSDEQASEDLDVDLKEIDFDPLDVLTDINLDLPESSGKLSILG